MVASRPTNVVIWPGRFPRAFKGASPKEVWARARRSARSAWLRSRRRRWCRPRFVALARWSSPRFAAPAWSVSTHAAQIPRDKKAVAFGMMLEPLGPANRAYVIRGLPAPVRVLYPVLIVLGAHFAAAGEVDRAVHYLELAGDRADQVFANDEAIALYRQALAIIGVEPTESCTATTVLAPERSATATRLCDKLADIFTLIDRFDEARSAALTGLALIRPEETFQAARLQLLLGKVEFQVGRVDAGMAAHAAAEELMRAPGPDDDQEWVELWLHLQLWDRYDVYALRGELERCAALVEAARPLAEARTSGPALATFYKALAFLHLRERRHRVDSQMVSDFRRAVEAAWCARDRMPARTSAPSGTAFP